MQWKHTHNLEVGSSVTPVMVDGTTIYLSDDSVSDFRVSSGVRNSDGALAAIRGGFCIGNMLGYLVKVK